MIARFIQKEFIPKKVNKIKSFPVFHVSLEIITMCMYIHNGIQCINIYEIVQCYCDVSQPIKHIVSHREKK